MQHEENQDLDTAVRNDVREGARKALLQLLEPLAGFASDAGLSAGEFYSIFREAAVRSAVAKQLEDSDRVNISGIAATTGIPRSNISHILKTTSKVAEKMIAGQQQSTNRVLAAWHEDPKFTNSNGQPADLKMYGRGATFDALTKRYGRGIPTRAMLDELVRGGAVELLPTQRIRARSYIAVERGMSARAIKAFGDRAADLLLAMLINLRRPDAPTFIASISESSVSTHSLPLFRKELSAKSADFMADVRESLNRRLTGASSQKSREANSARVSVTIFTHESFDKRDLKKKAPKKRRNFRREV